MAFKGRQESVALYLYANGHFSMLNEKKLDRRVVRTRGMLQRALLALMSEQSYDTISVADITDRADLRRATFYLHYRDKEELLVATLEGMFNELVAQVETVTVRD